MIEIKRGFADTPGGQIHYASAGSGKPVLLLHQTPRSWDEYREVLPILARRFRAIAMDTVGFGDSYRPERKGSIEEYARGVIDFLDAMEIERTALVGHHTGAVIAMEVAACYPERCERLVLSASPYVDAAERERRKTAPPIDHYEVREDGTHLTELWGKRRAFYPRGRPDLFTRLIIDALKLGERVEEGHQAVGAYRMEDKAPRIGVPTLLLAGDEDPFSHPRLKPLADAIPGSEIVVIAGGMVPMVDQMPETFAEAVLKFLLRE